MEDSTTVHIGIPGGRVAVYRKPRGMEAVMALSRSGTTYREEDVLTLGMSPCGEVCADNRGDATIPRSGWIQIPNMMAWVRKEGT